MKTIWRHILAAVVASLSTCETSAQGTFQNLGFESATVPLSEPPSPPGVPTVDVGVALPGWSAFIGTNQVNQVMYNSQTLDTTAVALLRDNYPFINVIEGSFSVFLLGGLTVTEPGTFLRTDASLAQNGLVPANAQSIRFKALNVVPPLSSVAVFLGGQPLSLVPLQATSQYTLYGADVTPYSGQTEELRFTIFSSQSGGGGTGWVLDSIVFSPEPVPEPDVFAFFGLGALLLGWRLPKTRKR